QSMQIQSGVLKKITTESKCVGYDVTEQEAKITDIIFEGELVNEAEAGDTIYFILEETQLYAGSGGQVGDEGTISNEQLAIYVDEVTQAPNGQNLHKWDIQWGAVKGNCEVLASVNHKERRDIKQNHSAAHLLHAALKEVLGDHVNQAGSLVEADRLRFDFSHFGPLTEAEIEQVERRVNEEIWNSIDVNIQEMPIEDAKKL